jgi:hypothetical protein
MKIRLFGCRKFGRLLNEREDRCLTVSEEMFLVRHRSACDYCRCQESASQLSLNMLRAATMDVSPGRAFDERVLRRVRIVRVRESLSYWSPALLGSAIACMALLVTLHLLSTPGGKANRELPNGEARLNVRSFPSLELNQLPPFVR